MSNHAWHKVQIVAPNNGAYDRVQITGTDAAEKIIAVLAGEGTDLTTGIKVRAPMPEDGTFIDALASVGTAGTGSAIELRCYVDEVDGLDIVATIDATEKTSDTSATAVSIDNPIVTRGKELLFEIQQIGVSTPGTQATLTVFYYPVVT